MKKYYLLSGSETNLNAKVLSFFKEEITKDRNISFLALSFDEYEANDKCYVEIQKQFYNVGITFQKSCLIDGRTPRESAQKSLRASNVIFIISPCKTTNFEEIEAYGLIPILKDFEGIIVGLGVGAVSMNNKVSYIEKDKVVDYNGLGITDYNLVVNLDFNDIKQLKDIFKISKMHKVLALVDKAFIKVVDGKEEFFGEYYYFDKEEFLFDGASYEKIKHNGDWDYKTQPGFAPWYTQFCSYFDGNFQHITSEYIGNFNYGYTGSFLFSLDVLHFGSSAVAGFDPADEADWPAIDDGYNNAT